MKGKKIINTPEMEQFIMDNQYGISRQALADKLNEQFKTKLNAKHVSRYCANHNLSNGNDGRFVKGQAAANKGVPISAKTYEKIKATMFKPGNVPKNHRPVGSERVNVDGYIEIKIAEPRKWTLKHRYIWEKANGPIPKGCVIIFVDQNKLNVSLDNLRLIKKSHLCEINRLGSSLTSSKELNSAIIDVAELSVAINKAKKERNQMKLRNKEERKEFLNDYKNWELWKAVPELGIELYRYLFDNGDQIIVTEYTRNAERYVLAEGVECKYHLLLTQNSEYRNFEPNRSFTHYEPNGVATGTIIDYLTKRRDIEV